MGAHVQFCHINRYSQTTSGEYPSEHSVSALSVHSVGGEVDVDIKTQALKERPEQVGKSWSWVVCGNTQP